MKTDAVAGFRKNYEFFRPLRERTEGLSATAMPTFKIPGATYIKSSAYLGIAPITDVPHVEASYTVEELKVIKEVDLTLTLIASGKADGSTVSLADRIEANFLRQDTDKKSFGNAVFDSLIECYKSYGELYPEQIPNLHAMFQTQAVAGTNVVTIYVTPFLHFAFEGKLSKENARTFRALPNEAFAMPYAPGVDNSDLGSPFNIAFARTVVGKMEVLTEDMLPKLTEKEPTTTTHERHCAGMGFAKEVIRQAAEAAVRLSTKSGIREVYTNSPMDEYLNIVNRKDEILKTTTETIEQIFLDGVARYIGN